jgi:hypothetical protein
MQLLQMCHEHAFLICTAKKNKTKTKTKKKKEKEKKRCTGNS